MDSAYDSGLVRSPTMGQSWYSARLGCSSIHFFYTTDGGEHASSLAPAAPYLDLLVFQLQRVQEADDDKKHSTEENTSGQNTGHFASLVRRRQRNASLLHRNTARRGQQLAVGERVVRQNGKVSAAQQKINECQCFAFTTKKDTEDTDRNR